MTIAELPPTRLRVEHGARPIGLGCAEPRLSWWLPSGAQTQEAYRIEVTIDGEVVTTSQVASPDSVLRPWPFAPLVSRAQASWRVQVRTEAGWSPWSLTAPLEVGLLQVEDWAARFIGHPDDGRQPAPRGERGAVYLRHGFRVDEAPERARLYATARGLYELHLDGRRIGDLELTPGFTAYRSHLEVQTYDVTELVQPGEHTLVATLTDGWWRGSVGYTREDRCYGEQLALLAQLELVDAAGRRHVVTTDESWEATDRGPVVAADLMEGQRIDLRMPFPPDDGWCPVTVVGTPDQRLTASPAPPTRATQVYRPVSVTRLDAQRQIVDLGANINGRARLSTAALGPDGNRVRLDHAERLGGDGDIDTDHLLVDLTEIATRRSGTQLGAGQRDEIVSAGTASGDVEPRHTTHGFQFVRIDGADDLTVDDVAGVMVHTDMARTGWFGCSDPRLEALHDAVVLSFRGNACEIPTDCPQRERAGWTGDWQLFVPTAAFLYDVAGFGARWLRDLAADQWDDGRVPNFVPDPYDPAARKVDIVRFMTGSAGWGDAAVLVPQQLWQSYGDVDLLASQYTSMQRWVDFALRRAANHRHPRRVMARSAPAAHERYLWDIGFHWGEWLEPGGDATDILTGEADAGDVATAYLHRSLATLADIAGILGRDTDAASYTELAGHVRAAWQAEYLHDDGTVTPATQANLVRALAFDLVDDRHRARVADDLVKLIRDAGTHLGTGFLATPFLLPVLADHGHLDVAYELLLQTTPPSWLAMIDAGATTMWENWEGVDAGGRGSLNHYSKGAVASFLHSYVAGIRPVRGVPGYRQLEIRPHPGGGLTHAHGRLDTPYGTVSSRWHTDGATLALDVGIPPGTQAVVAFPDGTTHGCGPGPHRLRGALL